METAQSESKSPADWNFHGAEQHKEYMKRWRAKNKEQLAAYRQQRRAARLAARETERKTHCDHCHAKLNHLNPGPFCYPCQRRA